MSQQQSLEQFFTSKIFNIPKYQRSYAWGKDNIRDLYEDIAEAIEVKSDHYIGTIVLAETSDKNIYHVVDGQQRITTLLMFLCSIINKLENNDDKNHYRRLYIQEKGIFKLTPLQRDSEFYFSILSNNTNIEPLNKSQRNLLDAYDEINRITSISVKNPDAFLKALINLSVLTFIEKNESDAIRIFQAVNDRGISLSKMDKTKSLLFYFSNKYSNRKHDDFINNSFAEIFECYDSIKTSAENENITLIKNKSFTEDDLLRQHHICYSNEDYDPTASHVLNHIKLNLNKFRKQNLQIDLENYIKNYTSSLLAYCVAFKNLLAKVSDNENYYKIFSIQGLNASYYPIVIQLEKYLQLDSILPSKNISILSMIEIIDIRVLKVRDYNGKKHIAQFAYALNKNQASINKIEEHLNWFNSFEISNERFKDYLKNYNYFNNTGLLRALFIDYCEYLSGKKYSLINLKKIMASEPTIEHILSQTPNFKPREFGFGDIEDFENHLNLIGNLTLLEKKINSAVKNHDLTVKLNGYSKSKLSMTLELSTVLSIDPTFKKRNLKERSSILADYFTKRWST